MKVVIPEGTPDKVIGVAVALLKNAITVGRSKYSIQYDGFDIVFAPKRKLVVVTYPLPALVFVDKLQLPAVSDSDKDYYYSAPEAYYEEIPTDDPGYDEDHVVVSVGTDSIFRRSSIDILPKPTGLVENYSRSSILGLHDKAHLSIEGRVLYLNTLVDALYDAGRYEELYFLLQYKTALPNRIYSTEGSPFYEEGERVFYTTGDIFLGTTADGKKAVVRKVRIPYSQETVQKMSVPSYTATLVDETVLQLNSDILGQTRYFPYYYVAIPLDTILEEYACSDDSRTFAFAAHDIQTDTESLGAIEIEYSIGGHEYSISITQSQLAEIVTDGDWGLTGEILEADIFPAMSDATYVFSGSGYREDVQGNIIVSDCFFGVQVDDVAIPGAYDIVYAPDYMPEEEFAFSLGTSVHSETPTTGTRVTTRVHREGAVYDYTTVIAETRYFCVENMGHISGVNYCVSSHGLSSTSFNGEPDYETSTYNTLSNNSYLLQYEDGIFSAEVQTVVPENTIQSSFDMTAYSYYGLNRPNGTPNGSASLMAGLPYTSQSSFVYDASPFVHAGPYYKSTALAITHSYVGTTSSSPVSASGLEQDRNSRPWWHNPIVVADDAYNSLQTRIVVKSGQGTYFPVHVHTMDNTGVLSYKLYIDGEEYSGGALTEGPALPSIIDYGHDKMAKNVDVATYNYAEQDTFFAEDTRKVTVTQSVSVTAYTDEHQGQQALSADYTEPVFSNYATYWAPSTIYSDWQWDWLYSFTTIHHSKISYSSFWKKRTEADVPNYYLEGDYYADTVDDAGVGSSDEGFRLFPTAHGSVDPITTVHWRGATTDVDGLCILEYSVTADEYSVLLGVYMAASDPEAVTAAIEGLSEVTTVLYNNFASPQMIRYFMPGNCYTIFEPTVEE